MFCPKCKKEMKIMWQENPILFQDGSEHTEVIGSCRDCDFDATWNIITDADGITYESNLRRYFFG